MMELKIDFLDRGKFPFSIYEDHQVGTYHLYEFRCPVYIINRVFIGIDPGSRNIGISILYPDGLSFAYDINIAYRLPRIEDKIDLIYSIIEELLPQTKFDGYCIIEGASYGDRFGQVELATARTAIYFACKNRGIFTYIFPPKLLRKLVHENGKISGDKVFPIKHNAANSLTFALACQFIEELIY